MGKAADNERIKLRATWFNNISVGLFVAGSVLPYLTLFQQLPEHMVGDRLQLTNLDVGKMFGGVAAVGAALFVAWVFRGRADEEIRKIQD